MENLFWQKIIAVPIFLHFLTTGDVNVVMAPDYREDFLPAYPTPNSVWLYDIQILDVFDDTCPFVNITDSFYYNGNHCASISINTTDSTVHNNPDLYFGEYETIYINDMSHQFLGGESQGMKPVYSTKFETQFGAVEISSSQLGANKYFYHLIISLEGRE